MSANIINADFTVSYTTSPRAFHELCLRIAERLSENLAFGNEICETNGDTSERFDFTCSYAFTGPITSDQVLMLKSAFRGYGLETDSTAFVRGGRYLTINLVSVCVDHGENQTRRSGRSAS